MANSTYADLQALIQHVRGKRVLLLTTSNRWSGDEGGKPKSTQIADMVARALYDDSTDSTLCKVIDIPSLNIYNCEGNVSSGKGNGCGVKAAALKDPEKNPTGNHRCWASINNADDELWKVSKAIFESDVVLFFVSTRWGQANAYYQKLIERLTWLDNRHSTLGETNILGNIEAGGFFIGHNWYVDQVVHTQRDVLQFYGFQTPPQLFLHWQWTDKATDETQKGYEQDPRDFAEVFKTNTYPLEENFNRWLSESGYDAGSRKPTPEEIEMCKSPEGFNQINHCKALGLIPREDGTKTKSKKYGGDA